MMPATLSGGHEGGSQNYPNNIKINYRRENTATVHVLDGQIKSHNIIKFVHEHFGVVSMLAFVPRSGHLYEFTLDGRAPLQYLLEGTKIGDKTYECRAKVQNSIMVRFLYLQHTLKIMKLKMHFSQ